MKISQVKDIYLEASGMVSELVRQLSFAGIAVIWVFKIGKDESGGIVYSDAMLMPLLFFVLTLLLDLVHYMYKTAIWGWLNAHHWRQHRNDDADVRISWKWNIPTTVLFWLKGGMSIAAYGLLFVTIYDQL